MKITGGNVDSKENITVLVDYKECLVNKFKASSQHVAVIKSSLKEKLLKELAIRFVDELPTKVSDPSQDQLLYDVCGYLLHTRSEVLDCLDCKNTLQTEYSSLPEDFLSAEYTASRSYGGLKYPSVKMFQTFQQIEAVVARHFQSTSHIYVRDTYEAVISKICETNIVNVCCESHPESLVFLITEYVQIRFFFEKKG